MHCRASCGPTTSAGNVDESSSMGSVVVDGGGGRNRFSFKNTQQGHAGCRLGDEEDTTVEFIVVVVMLCIGG